MPLSPPAAAAATTSSEQQQPFSDADIGDGFYTRILDIAASVGAKIVAMEVSDMAQAERVVGAVLRREMWRRCEIWCDGISSWNVEYGVRTKICEGEVVVRGEGNGRVVVSWR